ncbi:putative Gpa2-guanine nucleotide-binding protein alpha-2 subunit [Meredithblackwellia eburnea MCA 4105]
MGCGSSTPTAPLHNPPSSAANYDGHGSQQRPTAQQAEGFDSKPTEQEIKVSKSIDKMLREEEKRLAREVKMLLLGPGSSGKSTILKQMKVIHLSGFTPPELESYRQQIFLNVLGGMVSILTLLPNPPPPSMAEDVSTILTLGGVDDQTMETVVGAARELRENEPFPPDVGERLERLWAWEQVQTVVRRGKEGEVLENMPYFYSHLPRLFSRTTPFSPTEQDVLRCRQKTTGISETMFRSADLQYRLFDVGGQRSERKKWIHCFENVTAVLFLAAISGYDQALIEDPDSNQMQEALMLFDSICNSQWFVKTSIILFLNKVDIFKERILVSPIRAYFPDYEGDDTDYNAAREYFKARFTRLNRSQSKEIYTNYTTAIDTNLIRVVMASVYDIIVTRNLNEIIL